jgi:hypothetical protein
MPYSSYKKHYTDYRKDRQQTLPKRNPLKSIINPLTKETIELEWEQQRNRCGWAQDPEVLMFRSQQAANTKLREVYQKEIKRLTSIIKFPLYICTDGSREHRGNEAFWRAASGQNKSLSALIEKREEPYYDKNSSAEGPGHWPQNAEHAIWHRTPSSTIKADSTAFEKSCVKRWADSDPYLFMVNVESIDSYIETLKHHRQRVTEAFEDFTSFYRAHEYVGLDWKHHVDDLSDDNPYKPFRLKFEAEVQKLRDQKTLLGAKLEKLQARWDEYYCDEQNLEEEQVRLDKKFRQRSERRAELRKSLKEKRKTREETAHKELIEQVKEEMTQWKDAIHSGKKPCGCTSSPNSEGIRALKKHYSTLEDATHGAKGALIKSDLHLRPYKCPVKKTGRDGRHYTCGGYHLTKFE